MKMCSVSSFEPHFWLRFRVEGAGDLAAVLGELPRHWWVVALRGVAAIVFGVLAFVWPGVTLAVLILLFGAYPIVDRVLARYGVLRSGGKHVWAPVFEGIMGIVAGLVAFFIPGLTALALLSSSPRAPY